MKHQLLHIIAAVALLSSPVLAQAPSLGAAATFVLFTSDGALTNTSQSHLTGNVGSNNGSSTGFGNVNGTMHNANGTTGTAAADLLTAYNLLNSAVATFFPAPLLGNGQTLNAGIYSISGNSTLNDTLTFDGQTNANAVFIIKIQGSFSANANSKIRLINGAKACNVFWKIEGLASLASGCTMRGNLVVNNAAITMSSGVELEGRALSTTGAITIDKVFAYTPTGCGSPLLTGPASPTLGTTECFALFSGNGPVTNSGSTYANGDIGTNVGLTTGHNALNVSGAIHPIPNGITSVCATDLLSVYNYLNLLSSDIELLYPAQFGNGLVLTPHTYEMNGATTFIDTLFLNAEGNANARFVIQINGALSTGTYAKVKLINGAKAENVYWKIDGALLIDDYSEFVGTIVCNNGAIDLSTGVYLDGRALTTDGALSTADMTVTMATNCTSSPNAPVITTQPSNKTVCAGNTASFVVSATGSALTYQWKKGTVNLTNGGNISGATTATLIINPAGAPDVSTLYNVVVSSSTVSSTSNNAALVITTAPAITSQPANVVACTGETVSLAVTAAGGMTYQWKKGTVNVTNGGHIMGATTASLSFSPVQATDLGSYNVVITGACAPAVTSADAELQECGTVGIISVDGALVKTVNMYPNPFTSQLVVQMNSGPVKNSQLAIYNLLGEKVKLVNLTASNTIVKTSDITAGVYFYQVLNAEGNVIQTGKVISVK